MEYTIKVTSTQVEYYLVEAESEGEALAIDVEDIQEPFDWDYSTSREVVLDD